ncbi:hypothetical protein NC651_004926 [Populus alba x Populus x berolinensis]|nr:hypothetical protein NC651_004926 [Populus alba x Populus x berolinensis]
MVRGKLQDQDGNVSGRRRACKRTKKVFQLLNEGNLFCSHLRVNLCLILHFLTSMLLFYGNNQAANDCDLEPVAYEFFTQAFILYVEEVAIYFPFSISAKLLKKPDQCRAVYACSHLFWVDDQDGIKDGERVLLCLKRALRIANAAQQIANATRGCSGPVTLFIEILNKYLYFFEKGSPQITSAAIQGLIELITNEMQSDSTTPDPASDAFFASTIRYIQFQKQKGGVMGEKFGPIKV